MTPSSPCWAIATSAAMPRRTTSQSSTCRRDMRAGTQPETNASAVPGVLTSGAAYERAHARMLGRRHAVGVGRRVGTPDRRVARAERVGLGKALLGGVGPGVPGADVAEDRRERRAGGIGHVGGVEGVAD